jgi:hypothetical protein
MREKDEIHKELEEYFGKLQKVHDDLTDIKPDLDYPFEENLSFINQVKGQDFVSLIRNAPESDTSVSDLKSPPFVGVMGLKKR